MGDDVSAPGARPGLAGLGRAGLCNPASPVVCCAAHRDEKLAAYFANYGEVTEAFVR